MNAGKQREKILKLLMDWYPQVNAFEAKLREYQDFIESIPEDVFEELKQRYTLKHEHQQDFCS